MVVTRTRPAPDPERVWRDDKDCVRLNRTELTAMKWLLAMLCTTADGEKALAKRLDAIPDGRKRMRKAMISFKAISDDLIGTITSSQAKVLHGTMKDYDVRIVPKLSHTEQNVVISREQAMVLVDSAREKCKGCVEDGQSCRKCSLYRFLEAYSPIEDYERDNGLLCPYVLAEWEE